MLQFFRDVDIYRFTSLDATYHNVEGYKLEVVINYKSTKDPSSNEQEEKKHVYLYVKVYRSERHVLHCIFIHFPDYDYNICFFYPFNNDKEKLGIIANVYITKLIHGRQMTSVHDKQRCS